MTIKETKSEPFWRFNHEGFQRNVELHCSKGFLQFKKIIRSYIFFHLFFISLLSAEIILFSCSIPFLFQSSLFAFFLAGIVLTGFTYLVLILYFQIKKPEQFLHLRNWFMHLCKQSLPNNINSSEYHLSLANAAYRFATQLNKEESHLFQSPKFMTSLYRYTQKFTNLCKNKDILKMKEILLLVTINEHIQLIKESPTNLEAHASLANAYVALSKLYSIQKEKCLAAAEKAIQEFKIMDYYAPNDPWVHAQLASCYHDLQMYKEEIEEYEIILTLCPNDKEIMFRLGILYFQQGLNAKGLEVYEKLKKVNFSRIDELIDFYDANIKQEYYSLSN